MNSEEKTPQHNPALIILEAKKKVDEDDLDGAKMIFQSALLDWVDDAREMSSADSVTISNIEESIATLWVNYAKLYDNGKKVNNRHCCFSSAYFIEFLCILTE